MNVSAVGGIGATSGIPAAKVAPKADSGFGDIVGKAIETASKAEQKADRIATDIATGGSSSVHELMVATTEATLSLELMVQVRNKAVEAYQEIMRIQV